MTFYGVARLLVSIIAAFIVVEIYFNGGLGLALGAAGCYLLGMFYRGILKLEDDERSGIQTRN